MEPTEQNTNAELEVDIIEKLKKLKSDIRILSDVLDRKNALINEQMETIMNLNEEILRWKSKIVSLYAVNPEHETLTYTFSLDTYLFFSLPKEEREALWKDTVNRATRDILISLAPKCS